VAAQIVNCGADGAWLATIADFIGLLRLRSCCCGFVCGGADAVSLYLAAHPDQVFS
jgi:hypothetical protein